MSQGRKGDAEKTRYRDYGRHFFTKHKATRHWNLKQTKHDYEISYPFEWGKWQVGSPGGHLSEFTPQNVNSVPRCVYAQAISITCIFYFGPEILLDMVGLASPSARMSAVCVLCIRFLSLIPINTCSALRCFLTVCGACKVGKLVPLFSGRQPAPKTAAGSRMVARTSQGRLILSFPLVCSCNSISQAFRVLFIVLPHHLTSQSTLVLSHLHDVWDQKLIAWMPCILAPIWTQRWRIWLRHSVVSQLPRP